MGKVYAPPKELGPPPHYTQFNKGDYKETYKLLEEAEKTFIKNLAKWCKGNGGGGEYIGEEIRFQVADGFACYMVLSLKPVKLIFIPFGDAYSFPYVERLVATDIKKQIDSERRIAKHSTK